MQDEGEESGEVGEDAGQDDGISCLVVHYGMQQLHALINRQLLDSREAGKEQEHVLHFLPEEEMYSIIYTVQNALMKEMSMRTR